MYKRCQVRGRGDTGGEGGHKKITGYYGTLKKGKGQMGVLPFYVSGTGGNEQLCDACGVGGGVGVKNQSACHNAKIRDLLKLQTAQKPELKGNRRLVTSAQQVSVFMEGAPAQSYESHRAKGRKQGGKGRGQNSEASRSRTNAKREEARPRQKGSSTAKVLERPTAPAPRITILREHKRRRNLRKKGEGKRVHAW